VTPLFDFLAEHFDLPVLDWILTNLRSPLGDKIMPAITALGDAGILWIAVTILLLCLPKYRKAGIAMGTSLLMGLIICNLILKPLAARIRPYDYQLEHFGTTIYLLISQPHDYSFPSGHTAASFEAATALFLYNRKLGIPALVLAGLIAFSRLYLYVHYPTDVLFSVALGIGLAFLARALTEKAYSLRKS